MEPAQWAKVQAVFAAALELSGDERDAFVRSATSDSEVREEVRSLLQNAADDDFLGAAALIGGIGAIESAGDFNAAGAADSEAPHQLTGAIVGDRYRLSQVLARGGHGVVFLAEDSRLSNRKVVVKILDQAADHQAWLQRRFRQEIEILSRISHPGVAGIRDCGEIAGQPYLVMDFIDGVTLREYMKSGLPLHKIAAMVAQIGSALRAAHLQGIVHRDLKPENIMVQQDAENGEHGVRIKLIDFGIAQVQRTDVGRTTTVLMIAGTARYMAPEQFLGTADAASDVYALAVVCFEMLAGCTPYAASDALEVAREQRSTPPEAILERQKNVPFHVKPLLASALTSAPEKRPGDAEAFGNALADALLRQPPGWIARARMRILRDVQSRILAAAVFLAVLATLLAVVVRFESAAHLERVIAASGVDDPLDEGFSTLNEVAGSAELTSQGTGIEAWSLFTRSQGFYVHELSREQKRIAMSRGWKLTGSAKLQEGGLYLGVDFLGAGPRFATGATLDGNNLTARAWTNQVSAQWQSLTAPISGDPHAYHKYELIFEPRGRAVSIKVDGMERIRGYAGLRQFQDRWGVAFGAHRWNSSDGRAAFRSVRFEILR